MPGTEEGESQRLPVWSEHVGDPILALAAKLTHYVVAGKVKYRSHVREGLESTIDGLNLFFTGGNEGKLILRL